MPKDRIERMFAEMGLLNEEARARFIEWSKMTLEPINTKEQTFIRISNTTSLNKEEQSGELE